MSRLFRTHSSVSCFFCQSTIAPPPRNPRCFRCPHCDCWNRFDAKGEIISHDAAMYDESMNVRSFELRGSPRKDRLPTTHSTNFFCRTCQTNQMLIANLLSNYLPSPEHPKYQQRSAALAEYQRSIEARYPPVCENCAPAIEEEIRKRDHMAQTQALGTFLSKSKRARQELSARSQHDRIRMMREIILWRARGLLWILTLVCTIAGHVATAAGYTPISIPDRIKLIIPFVALLSLFWTAWDPTFAKLRRAQYQGRDLRQRGKQDYNLLQIAAWTFRCVTSLLLAFPLIAPGWTVLHFLVDPSALKARIYSSLMIVIELAILIRSQIVLRLERPPPVRLTLSSPSRQTSLVPTSRAASPAEPDLFLAPLTLSSKPVMTHPPTETAPHPIFGVPSLPTWSAPPPRASIFPAETSFNTAMDIEEDNRFSTDDPDAMDWTPIKPNTNGWAHTNADDGSWMRPQRFFAPEEPTGLEHLFASTVRLTDDESNAISTRRLLVELVSRMKWMWLGALIIVPLAAVAYNLGRSSSRNIVTTGMS
ncbi:hypothetical protein WOLCODRAFT_129941 [Wolfiporia cocos MD-104 SS10]|uniref:Ima1 N-terminal domain-containing protein n=1 Tax=Wolfiporia cocos (strain MD-104) TaxID=742152 RepID=A0A2H3JAP1_WOLCO|nr:hypothetical protein WOLCODRAFT_129941 [Wolfiporia cocos MD-104 SS10]